MFEDGGFLFDAFGKFFGGKGASVLKSSFEGIAIIKANVELLVEIPFDVNVIGFKNGIKGFMMPGFAIDDDAIKIKK